MTGEVAPEEFCAVPVEYHIDHKARLVTITGRGNVVLEEILDCMHAIAAQDLMPYAKLFDTREAVGVFSDSDIMTMGAWAQANASYDQRGAAAIVATGTKAIENMRRFMNLAAGDRPIGLFVAVEEAKAWLDQLKRGM